MCRLHCSPPLRTAHSHHTAPYANHAPRCESGRSQQMMGSLAGFHQLGECSSISITLLLVSQETAGRVSGSPHTPPIHCMVKPSNVWGNGVTVHRQEEPFRESLIYLCSSIADAAAEHGETAARCLLRQPFGQTGTAKPRGYAAHGSMMRGDAPSANRGRHDPPNQTPAPAKSSFPQLHCLLQGHNRKQS